jgi:multiple sugar transport system ATP-binding protein
MASIKLDRLRKQFKEVLAVEGLNLDIEDGMFVAFLGPSGCGKTTTMNMIAGLEQPTSGDLYFDGKRMNDVPAGKRGVGFVFQNYAIFTHMTVYENVGFGLKVRGCPEVEMKREVGKVAELLELTPMLDWNAGKLSINDMQKVALGRSMITNPGIFLLDEPFSNLDATFRAYMRGELKRIQREIKQTMIYVTHDQVEAMSMADRIAVMYCGQLYQWGSPDDVYNRPVNTFVARFIGSPNMNFIECSYEVENGQGFLSQKKGGLRMPLDAKRRRLLEDRTGPNHLILGIRPEHMKIYREPAPNALWQGTAYAIEPLGPITIAHTEVGGDRVQVKAPGGYRARPGDPQWVALDLEYSHVFDGETKLVIR